MPIVRGILSTSLLVLVASLMVGCEEKPEIFPADQPALYGGVEFELGRYTIRYLELADEDGQTYEYPKPVLVVPLTIRNRGEAELAYNPTHRSQQMSEAETPLLFPGPTTEEVDWKEFSRRPIPGVVIERGQLEGQLTRAVSLAPGDEVTDLFLFELPDPDEEILFFSIPPTMHRGDLPAFLRIRYQQPTEIDGPQVAAVGDELSFDGVTFTVTEVSQLFLPLSQGGRDGFSADAVLRVSYRVSNGSEAPVVFNPAHRELSGNRGALLHSLHTEFNRIRFGSSVTVKDQQDRVTIEPGESVEDFAVFERPPVGANVGQTTFEFAASHFQRSGRVRVAFAYEHEDVERPQGLQAN
jgi:hypothetical protein